MCLCLPANAAPVADHSIARACINIMIVDEIHICLDIWNEGSDLTTNRVSKGKMNSHNNAINTLSAMKT